MLHELSLHQANPSDRAIESDGVRSHLGAKAIVKHDGYVPVDAGERFVKRSSSACTQTTPELYESGVALVARQPFQEGGARQVCKLTALEIAPVTDLGVVRQPPLQRPL